MTTTRRTQHAWRRDLRAIADELATIGASRPGQAMTLLSTLIDNASATALIPRLRAIRSAAAQAAVEAAGSQAEVARQEGISAMAVSLAVRAARPHASRDGREVKAQPAPPVKAAGMSAPRRAKATTRRAGPKP